MFRVKGQHACTRHKADRMMEDDPELCDVRDWETELEGAKKALAEALKKERSWEGEAKSLRRSWERQTEECNAQRRRVNELRYEVEKRLQENNTVITREKG